MSEKWTPGPWSVEHVKDDGAIYIAHPKTECNVTTICNIIDDTEEDFSNAHIIAAAPELYDALNGLYKLLWDASDGKRVWTLASQDRALKALKKARGDA
jgi:hypothetical protein